jgi:hypothetical protein
MRRRLARALALGVMAVGLAAGAASAAGRSTVGFFQTPSHNIVCMYLFGGAAGSDEPAVDCGIKSGLKPPPRRITCTAGDPTSNFVDLGVTGRAVEPSCAGDPGPLVGEAGARVLAYGTTWRHGAVSCSSAVTGLTCRNRSGHGFFLSRAHSRRF